MSVIYLLITISICVAGVFLGAFIWAVKTGQFDDNYGPAVRILFDDNKLTQDNKNDHSITSKSNKQE